MLSRQKKEEVVGELIEKFKGQKVSIFSNFHGISVAKIQSLRRALKKDDAEYRVAKKTLIDRALAENGIPTGTKELEGEIGIAFGYSDEVLPARTLLKFSKENETFKIVGGILGGKIMGGKQMIALAKLPSREILLSQLVGVMAGPVRGLAVALQANIRGLALVLRKVIDQKT